MKSLLPPATHPRVAASNTRPGRTAARIAAAVMLTGLAGVALAQSHETRHGQHVLRGSMVDSTAIAASTARAHGIEPAADTAVLNVVVLKQIGERQQTVDADVDARVRNLLGAVHDVDLKPVRSNGRIAYVAPITHAPAETLDVHITARPRDGAPPLELDFRERVGLGAH